MTTAFMALYRGACDVLRRRDADVVEIDTETRHRAFSLAWRDLTKSERCEGTFEGPGTYVLSGYRNDDGRDVAVVEMKEPK